MSYEAAPAAVEYAAPAPVSDSVIYEGGSNFIEPAPMELGAPMSDCGCGDNVIVEGAASDMGFISEGAPVMQSPIIDSGVIEGTSTEGIIDSTPTLDVPPSPVGDSSSYMGAPALQPGEWVVEDSDKVVVESTEGESAGVEATPVSSQGEVIYESATPAAEAPAAEAPAADAVPGAPSEEKAAE